MKFRDIKESCLMKFKRTVLGEENWKSWGKGKPVLLIHGTEESE